VIRASQLVQDVIRPTLKRMELWSEAAERLLALTAGHESLSGSFVRQHPTGPALGLYQMEGWVHDDCWSNWIAFRPKLRIEMIRFCPPNRWRPEQAIPQSELLMTDMAYATAMARVQYQRAKPPLPAADDFAGLAGYWKAHWNTVRGKGTPAQLLADAQTVGLLPWRW
jgi:hypothetical protein